jgi:7-cyano-7-deazaguanine synthase in queuosine biosynthesis
MYNIYIVIATIIVIILLIDYPDTNYDKIDKYPLYRAENLYEEDRKLYNVCWTGGYDSTFRICELIHRGKQVQPLYFNVKNMDNSKWRYQRNNRYKEIQAMKDIRKRIQHKYPEAKHLLLQTKFITKVPQVPEVTKAFYVLYKQGHFTRPLSQYECIARHIFLNPDTLVDIGEEKSNTGLDSATKRIRQGVGDNCRIKLPLKGDTKAAYIFQNFRMPIVHLTKEDMLKIANNRGFNDILKLSWSCWFPKKGKPCGKCDMCKHRVI